MNNKKWIKLAVFLLLLSACSDDADSTDSSGNGGKEYIGGEFKSAGETGFYAPSDPAVFGEFAECHSVFNYHYFESENVLVYGDPDLPDTDYMHAASLVEGQLQTAFSKTGFTEQEFRELRPKYSVEVQRLTITDYLITHYVRTDNGLDEKDITDVDPEFLAPYNWDELDSNQRTGLVASYWNSITREKQAELIKLYEQLYDLDLEGNNTIPEKVVVCLDAKMNEINWGQGTLLGMNIAPISVAARRDAGQVVLHELVHWIQLNVSTPIEPTLQIHDRWFMEGMASYLSDQNTASNAGGYYPVNVISYDDEFTHFSDAGVAYTHYARAFQYLHEHSGPERVKKLLLQMRYSKDEDRYAFLGKSSERFSRAFSANMVKANGQPLTIEEFRQNYHSLVD